MKCCQRCKADLPETEFFKNARRADGLQAWCKKCLYAYRVEKKTNAAWYQRNAERERIRAREKWQAREPEERKAFVRARYWSNRDMFRASMKKYSQRLKRAAFDAYGGPVCACCGEDNLLFMSIDHIVPCGMKVRAEQGGGSRLYVWLKKNGYPEGFQVLCFNCNLGRNVTRGECPHKLLP